MNEVSYEFSGDGVGSSSGYQAPEKREGEEEDCEELALQFAWLCWCDS